MLRSTFLKVLYHPCPFQVTSYLVFPIVSSAFSFFVCLFVCFNAIELDTINSKSCFEVAYCFKFLSVMFMLMN